jgi:hypothetical protein
VLSTLDWCLKLDIGLGVVSRLGGRRQPLAIRLSRLIVPVGGVCASSPNPPAKPRSPATPSVAATGRASDCDGDNKEQERDRDDDQSQSKNGPLPVDWLHGHVEGWNNILKEYGQCESST